MTRADVAVLALHGNGGGAARFAAVAPRMPPDVALHAVTLPGFAEVPRDPALTSTADYGRVVLDHLRDLPRPRVVLGHGIGGALALEALRQDPGAADGLVLHAPVGVRLDTRLLPRVARVPGVLTVLRRGISSRVTRPLVRRRLFGDRVPRRTADAFLQAYGRCEVFAQMFSLVDAPWFASLPPLHLPAVLLWGAGDDVLAVDQAREWSHVVPAATVEVVDAWTHWPMLEQPEHYAATVARLARGLALPVRPR